MDQSSVAVTNNGYGFAVGYKGVIYRTTNNGSSWSQLLSGNQSGSKYRALDKFCIYVKRQYRLVYRF